MKPGSIEFLTTIEYLYENIYKLLKAFQEASTMTGNDTITVSLRDKDGSYKEVSVNSFQKLESEIKRISDSFNALTNEMGGSSVIMEPSGSFSKYFKDSLYYKDFSATPAEECIVSYDSVVNELIHPIVSIPINITSDKNHIPTNNILVTAFNINDGWADIEDNITFSDFNNLVKDGLVTYDYKFTKELPLIRSQMTTKSKFIISNISRVNTHEFNLTLDTLIYESITKGNISLNIGDVLTDSLNSTIIVNKITGNIINVTTSSENISPMVSGNDQFISVLNTPSYIPSVRVPVKPLQKLLLFISFISNNEVSYPSNSIKVDTENSVLTHEGRQYTIDEFFSKYVINLNDYLMSIVEENTIPYSLGIKPDKPKLLADNFKVVQINKHVTSAKTIEEINQLNAKKQSVQNEIDYKDKQIDDLKVKLETTTFKTISEKNQIISKIDTLQNDIIKLNANILTISRNIDNNALNNSLKNIKPKYRILGFWEIQSAIMNSVTGVQNVIKYDVQYRYLNRSSDDVLTTTFNMIDKGEKVSVTFSPWNNLETTSLNKVRQDGSIVWETQSNSSSDDVNINQCLISISENESVEVRVRAVSEAGYPISPLKSDWSEILRVDFPEDLKANNINSIVSKNDIDLANSEFTKILQSKGLLNHIVGQINEGDKTYHHPASTITSGQFTPELKNIPLDECISSMLAEINSLKSQFNNSLKVTLKDFDGNDFNISNGEIIDLFGGFYSDEYKNVGDIIRKTAYIHIKNDNNVPVEIKSLKPGLETPDYGILLDDLYKNVPVMNQLTGDLMQQTKQIIYFRNCDMSMQHNNTAFQLYVKDTTTYPNWVNNINESVTDELKNVVGYKNGQNVKGQLIQSINNNDYALFSSTYEPTQADFDRISRLNSVLKSSKQNQITDNVYDLLNLGFDTNDIYAVGKYTCGAFFYPVFKNINNYLVKGNESNASLMIDSKKEIIIPIVFEYRMIDALGNIDGVYQEDGKDIKYVKYIGIDLLINNNKFYFDVRVTSRFKM